MSDGIVTGLCVFAPPRTQPPHRHTLSAHARTSFPNMCFIKPTHHISFPWPHRIPPTSLPTRHPPLTPPPLAAITPVPPSPTVLLLGLLLTAMRLPPRPRPPTVMMVPSTAPPLVVPTAGPLLVLGDHGGHLLPKQVPCLCRVPRWGWGCVGARWVGRQRHMQPIGKQAGHVLPVCSHHCPLELAYVSMQRVVAAVGWVCSHVLGQLGSKIPCRGSDCGGCAEDRER